MGSFQLLELPQLFGITGTGSIQRSHLRAVLLQTLWITSFLLSPCPSKVTLRMVDALSACLESAWAGRGGRGCFPRSGFPELTENEVGFV